MSALQRRLMLLVALALVIQALANFASYFVELGKNGLFGGDFLVFWNAARHVYAGKLSAIYDAPGWRAVFGHRGTRLLWFPYPPFTLLFLWPLGALSYGAAVSAWSLAPLAPFGAFAKPVAQRCGLGEADQPRLALGVLAALTLPWLASAEFCGQTGVFFGALFLAIAWAWPDRPILLGVCVGLFSMKPQLGLLLPVALVLSGQWRALAAAAATAAALCIAATLWLGPGIWSYWLALTRLFSQTMTDGYFGIRLIALSPYVSLLAAGAPKVAAGLVQAAISIAVILVVAGVFRRRDSDGDDGRTDLRLGLLAAGGLLATPYALAYDMPLLALALIPLFARAWRAGWDGLELAALTALVVAPFAMPTLIKAHIPFSFLALGLTFIALGRRYVRDGRASASQAVATPAPAMSGVAA